MGLPKARETQSMAGSPIIDVIQTLLLPRIHARMFQWQPSAAAGVAGRQHYLPVYPYHIHSHDFFEWVWCVENHSFIQIRDSVYRLDTGDFCFLSPGMEHADVMIPSLNRYTVLWCRFQDNRLTAGLNTYVPIRYLPVEHRMNVQAPLSTIGILSALQSETDLPTPAREPVVHALIMALAHLMLQTFESCAAGVAEENAPGAVSSRVDRYLQANFQKPLKLDEIARALFLSRNHLATLYKHETGKTIGHTLTTLRMAHAKNLLIEKKMPVHAVAKAVGYTTPEHFSRLFLRYEGVTPRRYGR